MTIYSGFTYYRWWFSIAMLNDQRVSFVSSGYAPIKPWIFLEIHHECRSLPCLLNVFGSLIPYVAQNSNCAGHFLNNLVTELSKPPNHCCLMKLPSVCFFELHENHDITSFSPFSLGEKNKSFISIYISRTSEPPSHTPIILHRARCWMCVPWVSPQLSPKDRPHGSPELSPSIPEADEIIVFWGKSTGKPGIFMPQILAGFRCRCFWPPIGEMWADFGVPPSKLDIAWYDMMDLGLNYFQAKIEAGYQITFK